MTSSEGHSVRTSFIVIASWQMEGREEGSNHQMCSKMRTVATAVEDSPVADPPMFWRVTVKSNM